MRRSVGIACLFLLTSSSVALAGGIILYEAGTPEVGFASKIFYNISVIGWTSLFAAIFFSTGLITLSLSVVGLYISKLFVEIKQRPRYLIREYLE